ncbi:MAG: carboxylesterase family protein, partial [bacterium]
SAGSASCTLLPLLQGSHAYFKRVIGQSGTPALTRSAEIAVECTNVLLETLGCKTAAELAKVDAQTLFEASAVLALRQFPERDGIHLPADPWQAYANGAAKDITFLQGCNKDEMNFFVVGFGVEAFEAWAADRRVQLLAKLSEQEKALVESYLGDVQGESWEPDCRLLSQSWFNAPAIRLSENQTMAGGRCYTYHFTPESPDPIMKCGHAIELASVFNHPEMSVDTGRVFDETFSRTVRRMWVQFAKTGNPSLTAEQSPDGKAKEWPPYDLENRQVMALDEFDIHPAKEAERKIVDWDRTYFLTGYYAL